MAPNAASRRSPGGGSRRGLRRSLVLLLPIAAPFVSTASAEMAHRRLRARAPAGGAKAAAPRLPATQYVGSVSIGQPQQEFRVIFDTASGTMVVPSVRCEDAACMGHKRFAAENSTTAIQIGWADDPLVAIHKDDDRDTKSFSFLGADVSGEFMRDSVCVGHQCSAIDFVGLTEESMEPFSQLQFDGVLGLAPTSPDAKEFNFLQAILKGRKPSDRMFGFYLAAAGQDFGELTFGGYSKERASSALHWVPTSTNDTWHIMVEDISVGGQRTGMCEPKGCEASVDTGSSLILAPGNMLWTMLTKLGIDDDCTAKAPSLSFVVGGQPLQLEMDDYVERDAEGCRLLFGSTSNVEKAPALVLGYPFLRKFYSVFDAEQHRIGFALANHASGPSKGLNKDVAVVPLVGLRP